MYIKLKANQLFNGYDMLDGDHVLILNKSGRVEEIVSLADAGDDVRELKGVLSPGFINCHCHIELSHTQGVIPSGIGLIPFLSGVMKHRKADPEQMQDALEKAEEELWNNGTVAVGDICNTDVSISLKAKSRIKYLNFLELAGLPESIAEERYQSGVRLRQAFSSQALQSSIVPHAPYSVSGKLFNRIESDDANTIISIHNQETVEENNWYQNKSGGFADFYHQWNISADSFYSSGKSSLSTLLLMMNPSKKHILIHNLFTSEQDIHAAQSHFAHYPDNLVFCLCPLANLYIQNKLPDIDLFLKNNCRIVLGTDSLASNQRLSIYEEMRCLQKNFTNLSFTQLLRWATIEAATALNMHGELGSFEKGKQPGVICINDDKVMQLSS